VDFDTFTKAVANIESFKKTHRLAQVTLYYIGCKLTTPAETRELRDLFFCLDTRGTGTLNLRDIELGIEQVLSTNWVLEYIERDGDIYNDFDNKFSKKKKKEIKELAMKVQTHCSFDDDDRIDYSEFVTVALNRDLLLTDENLKLAYRHLLGVHSDKDTVEYEYFDQMLGGDAIENLRIFEHGDINNDGQFSFDEFRRMIIGMPKNEITVMNLCKTHTDDSGSSGSSPCSIKKNQSSINLEDSPQKKIRFTLKHDA